MRNERGLFVRRWPLDQSPGRAFVLGFPAKNIEFPSRGVALHLAIPLLLFPFPQPFQQTNKVGMTQAADCVFDFFYL